MSSHQDRVGIWISIHGYFETRGQVFLVRRVLNDRHFELVKETEHSLFTSTLWDAFDLFDLLDFEAFVFELLTILGGVSLYKESN